jgi:hypothetical protein
MCCHNDYPLYVTYQKKMKGGTLTNENIEEFLKNYKTEYYGDEVVYDYPGHVFSLLYSPKKGIKKSLLN